MASHNRAPDDIRQTVERMWSEGNVTLTEIGHAIGRSRSAVRGLIRRMGLEPRPQEQTQKPRRLKPVPVAIRADDESLPPTFNISRADGEPATILTLRPGECRFPMWGESRLALEDRHFCAARAIEGRPYCAAHAAVAYKPSERVHPLLRRAFNEKVRA